MASNVDILDVSKHYSGTMAVDSVTLNIEEKEFVTLLGPSGSGKTTLLMIIAGFIKGDTGRIFINGRDITRVSPNKRNIGVVFQNYALFPHMSVEKNIDYPLRIRRIGKKKRIPIIKRIIEVVRLQGLEKRNPSQLSGGQKQRVALARALVFNPPVLLMDEPLSALDKKLRDHMQLELKSIQEKMGITVLYVTHDQEEALTMSNRIAVMNSGRVEQVGSPAEIYDAPSNRFVAEFVGETNLFPSCILGTAMGSLIASGPGNGSISLKSNKHLYAGIKGYLSVRPEKMCFINGRDINCCTLKGCLEDTLYLGDTVKHFVRLKENIRNWTGSLVVMKLPNIGGFPYPRRGQEVKIGWKCDDTRFVV